MFRNVIPCFTVPATAAGISPLQFPSFGETVMKECHLPGSEVVQVSRVMLFHSWGAVFVHSATPRPASAGSVSRLDPPGIHIPCVFPHLFYHFMLRCRGEKPFKLGVHKVTSEPALKRFFT